MGQGPPPRPAARFDPLTDAADVVLRMLDAHECGSPLHEMEANGRDIEILRRVTPADLEEGMWFLMRLGLLNAKQTRR